MRMGEVRENGQVIEAKDIFSRTAQRSRVNTATSTFSTLTYHSIGRFKDWESQVS